MGARIVDLMVAAGVPTTLWARRPASLEPFAGSAADVASSPAQLAAVSDIIGVCVWDEHDVDEVLLGEHGVFAGIRPGSVVALHSTISPDACRRLGAEAAQRGAHVIDAPVSAAARLPKMLVMVGGEVAVFQESLPVLQTFGDPVVHLGPLGSGEVAKLVNNVLLAASIGLADDALSLGAALGLDRAGLLDALSAGSSRGQWTSFLTPRPLDAGGGRTMEWARKDVGLTLEVARGAGLDLDRYVLALGARGAEVVDRPKP